MNMIRYTLNTLPEATSEDLARLQKLAEAPDDSIDFSDIPQLTESFWANAKRTDELFRPRKRQITVRIDADVLDWLESGGKGYQSRLNDILRHVMLEQSQKPKTG